MEPQRIPEGRTVEISTPRFTITGTLTMPPGAIGVVLFAHGSGSSRHSPRNKAVARLLNEQRLATLLVDLLTDEEGRVDRFRRHLRFDIGMLADRLAGVTSWLLEYRETRLLSVGYFGSSTGAAAALVAAAHRPNVIGAVVSRGGRPDMAGPALPHVRSPTLLIVGGNDSAVIDLNRQAYSQLQTKKRLEIVPGAGHLFEEPGKLELVAQLAAEWFVEHLAMELESG